MRIRPVFLWLFLVVCTGVLAFAASVPVRLPALLQVQYPQHMTSTTSLDLIVRVTDTEEIPIDGAHLSLHAWMTDMAMQASEVGIAREKAGIYQIHIQFSMPGPWALHMSVQPPPGFLPIDRTVLLHVQPGT